MDEDNNQRRDDSPKYSEQTLEIGTDHSMASSAGIPPNRLKLDNPPIRRLFDTERHTTQFEQHQTTKKKL